MLKESLQKSNFYFYMLYKNKRSVCMCPLSIKLTDVQPFQMKKTKLVGNFHDYLICKGSLASTKYGMQTENINSCTAGLLNAGDKHFMFHAAPEMQSLRSVRQELEKQVEILRKTCDDIHGFICGGWELNTNSPKSVKSFDLYTAIADTLDDLGVKFTMVCGKEKGAPMDNLQAVNKIVTMWNSAFKKMFSGNPEELNQKQVADILENHYQFVETNSDDTISLVLKDAAKTQSLSG